MTTTLGRANCIVALAVAAVGANLLAKALGHNRRPTTVGWIEVMLNTMLAAEVEAQAISLHADVPVAQRRQSERAVRSRLFRMSHPRQRRLQHAH